ncbi:MAG: hypothetical protein DRJ01_16650 [Bacteroidetes bacterium]|nr:MAG: hypothetical protein DRJ01_16650 [Bacteroidota bacterium]
MNRFFLVLSILLIIITGCNRIDPSVIITYKTETIYPTNEEYNGIDTTYRLIDHGLIKEWNDYDKRFLIIDQKLKETIEYKSSRIDNKKYSFEVIDSTDYEITIYSDIKMILGYECQKAKLSTSSDTIILFYTNEIGVNYSPFGIINGFVLEYSVRSKYYNRHSVAINIDLDSKEKIEIPTNYIRTTQKEYSEEIRHFRSKENRNPFVIEGQKAPEFSILDQNGILIDLKHNKGNVLVFNFWFIGCRGCVQEIPDLNKIVEHFKENKNVKFYAFAGDLRNSINKFKKRKQFNFTLVPESDIVNHSYGVNAYPTTLIIDKSGTIIKTYYGKLIQQVGVEKVILEIENALK